MNAMPSSGGQGQFRMEKSSFRVAQVREGLVNVLCSGTVACRSDRPMSTAQRAG